MPLINWTKLFKIPNVNWISLQKEVKPDEEQLMKKYGIQDLHKILDTSGNAFQDTISILKSVDFIISTDTSLLHIAGTANINKCWALLTVGSEWRWTQDETTNWYPKTRLFRQKKAFDWTNVVDDLHKEITTLVSNMKNNIIQPDTITIDL
jgi:ADP-heptose:LPS heptosyltransferase